MAFVNPTSPNMTDFQDFLSELVQIPTAALPSNSPWTTYVYNRALAVVVNIAGVDGYSYTFAVYNLATHLLFMVAPDQSGQTYFANARSASGFNLLSSSAGVVQSASDNGTGSTLAMPRWAENLTVDQLAMMRTPYGREYLAYAQKFGTIVGLT